MFWRNGTELDVIRAVKAKTALDLCVVARKVPHGFVAPVRNEEGPEVTR
jgi:hypothetical protein